MGIKVEVTRRQGNTAPNRKWRYTVSQQGRVLYTGLGSSREDAMIRGMLSRTEYTLGQIKSMLPKIAIAKFGDEYAKAIEKKDEAFYGRYERE